MITFILPTIGRDSLPRTVASILGQSDPNWELFIVGDGWQPPLFNDSRIKSLHSPAAHHESPTMNFGIQKVTTDWVGILGDDDGLTPDYVKRLKEEMVGYDVVIFRQSHPRAGVFPRKPEIVWGNVGASYSAKTNLFKKYPFHKDFHEDLIQLQEFEASGARIKFSSSITYITRISERPTGNDTALWPIPDDSYAQKVIFRRNKLEK